MVSVGTKPQKARLLIKENYFITEALSNSVRNRGSVLSHTICTLDHPFLHAPTSAAIRRKITRCGTKTDIKLLNVPESIHIATTAAWTYCCTRHGDTPITTR
ncbi:uncharacterized protein AAEQ78_025336 isoform 2-T2 [Lycaon pictus]